MKTTRNPFAPRFAPTLAPMLALACLALPTTLFSEPMPTGRLMTDAVRNTAQSPRENYTPYAADITCGSIQAPHLTNRSISRSGRSFTARTLTPRSISSRTFSQRHTVSATTVSATRAVSADSCRP